MNIFSATRTRSMLLMALISAIASITITTAASTTTATIPLPKFTFETLINTNNTNNTNNNNNSIDLHEFRTHLNHATDNHLSEFIKRTASGATFQGLHLDSTVRRIHDRFQTDPRAIVETVFEGTALVSESLLFSEAAVHDMIVEALTGSDFWSLMHRFVEDDVLAAIDNLDVTIGDDSSTTNDGISTVQPNNEQQQQQQPNNGAVAVLAIFSIIMFSSTVFLLYLVHKRYNAERNLCCSSSKGSESTDSDNEEDDGIRLEDDETDFDDEDLKPKRRTKRRIKPHEKLVMDVPSLDSIQEEGEEVDCEEGEELSTVPLDDLTLI